MIVIIAGSRTIKDYDWLCRAVVRSGYPITEVVSGKERNGADALGERWASEHGVPVIPFPADWSTHGRSAGPIRNAAMAQYGQAAIILRRPVGRKSNGSDNLYRALLACHKPVYREIEGQEPGRLKGA